VTRPPCYVVSLARSGQRRTTIAASLGALGIGFEFIDAIDASTLAGTSRPTGATALGTAERACALSHRRAQQRLLDSGADHALILEDDALPGERLPRFLDEGHHRLAPLVLLFHSRARVYRRAVPLFGTTVAYPLAIGCTSAVAYTLDRRAATALVRANTPVRRTADWPLDLSGLGAQVVMPMIVGHPPRSDGQSTIAADRGDRPADPTRFLTGDYLMRRWRKLRSHRIS